MQQNAGWLFGSKLNGLFVPDSLSLAGTIKQFWAAPVAGMGWTDVNTLMGVLVLYAPEVAINSSLPTIFTNVALLWCTFALSARNLASMGIARFRWLAGPGLTNDALI